MNNQQICKKTRRISSDALHTSLKNLLKKDKPFSEVDLRDYWLLELHKEHSIFQDGWYIPPPHGIGILFGTPDYKSRQNYKTLRLQRMWPDKNIMLDKKNDLVYAYSSAVDKQTCIIGDFGLSIYFGKNRKIIKHFKQVFETNKIIFEYLKTGMKISDITKYALKVINKKGLVNNIVSTSDPTNTNIGHSIPGIYEGWTSEEKDEMSSGNSQIIADTISKKRVFVNIKEQTIVKPGMAFTIEPRLLDLKNKEIPLVSFHTIILIRKNGRKELLTNFEKIFRLVGMDYMV
ncbi:MAG: M24 family metallopeptidase [bacterium]|nr:M24 family metallopeptidase [bacterium]